MLFISRNDFSNKLNYSRFDFLLSHYKPGNILDIGNVGGVLGKGVSYSSHLKFVKLTQKNSKVYGFDLYDPKDKKKFPRQEQGNVEKKLPYKDNFFDTVYMGEIIEHLSNPGLALDNIHRVLKNDGVLILDTPNSYSLDRMLIYLFKRYEHIGDPTHVIFFTPAQLRALLKRHGFMVTKIANKYPGLLRKLPSFFSIGLGTHTLLVAKKIKS